MNKDNKPMIAVCTIYIIAIVIAIYMFIDIITNQHQTSLLLFFPLATIFTLVFHKVITNLKTSGDK